METDFKLKLISIHSPKNIYESGRYGKVFISENKAVKTFFSTVPISYGVQQSMMREMAVYTKCSGRDGIINGQFKMNSGKIELVMERGITNLNTLIHRLSRKQRKEIFFPVLKQLCVGLRNLHAEGFLHRDIKTTNIVWFLGHKYKLIDFGFTRGEGKMTNYEFSTKMMYVDEPYTYKTDVCQLGCVMFYLLLGFPTDIKNIKQHIDKGKGEECDIILRMIDENVENRIDINELCCYLNLTLNYKKIEYKYNVCKEYRNKKEIVTHINRYNTVISKNAINHCKRMVEIVYNEFKKTHIWETIINTCLIISSKLFDDISHLIPEDLTDNLEEQDELIILEKKILIHLNYKIPVI